MQLACVGITDVMHTENRRAKSRSCRMKVRIGESGLGGLLRQRAPKSQIRGLVVVRAPEDLHRIDTPSRSAVLSRPSFAIQSPERLFGSSDPRLRDRST